METIPENYSIGLVNDINGFDKAKKLIIEYADSIKIDLCFQDFETELRELHIQYQKPYGGLILVVHVPTDTPVGCVGIRNHEGDIAELKRMYVRPDHRKTGIGRHLLDHAIGLARELKFKKIRLDTYTFMKAAIKLYRTAGFKEIETYRYNPGDDVLYFELDLE